MINKLHTPFKSFCIFLLAVLLNGALLAQSTRFTLLHTSDEHSMLLPAPLVDYHPRLNNPTLGGYARLAAKVNEIRDAKSKQDVFLFSSGDILGGSPFAWLILNKKAAEIELMKSIGYDAIAIGNHEFDYGPVVLANYYLLADYPAASEKTPLMSANIDIPLDHPLQQVGIIASRIYSLSDSTKLGVFALLGKDAWSVAPFAAPIKLEDQHVTAKKIIQELKAEGADIIIALTHSGVAEDISLANEVAGIDIILGGHDHFTTYEPIETGQTIILHSGHYLQRLGILEFEVNTNTKKIKLINEREGLPYHYALDSNVPEDSIIQGQLNEYQTSLNSFVGVLTNQRFDSVASNIAKLNSALNYQAMQEHAVGNFLTDAMRLIAEQATNERVDLAFQANGIIRSNILPGSMDWSKSAINFMDLVTVSGLGMGPDSLPGYPMVSVYFTAQEVLNILELAAYLPQALGDNYFLQMSGIRMEYDPQHAYWFRIPIKGTPLPAYSAVKKADFYKGTGYQTGDAFEKIDPKSTQLYHVVTDYYLGAFLPMIGEKLPKLKVVPKNKAGEEISIEDGIIYRDGHELKVWQALAEYAATIDSVDGIGQIPDYYHSAGSRLIVVSAGLPLWIWPLIIAPLGLIILIITFIKRRGRS
jgi:5'-nucleotidase / UDP-sugar diphosphatase